jgi:tetratricopeptide (TPR) repeat protein
MRRVVQAAPDFGPAWCRLGDAEFKAGRYDSAAEAWRRAIALPEPQPASFTGAPPHVAHAPLAVYATVGLARVALVRGDADGARQMLEDVTRKAPGFGAGFRLLADAYTALNRDTEAERAARTADSLPSQEPFVDPMVDALARESRSSTFLLRQAAAADLSGRSGWREYLLRRALEFEPDNPDVVFELGTTLRRLDRDEEALELLLRRERMVAGDYQVLGEIGRSLAALGRLSEAEAYLRRALQGIDDAVSHHDLALVLTRLGRIDEAIAEYRRALDRHPNDVDARNNLAVRLINLGRLQAAKSELERVLEIDPDHALAHTNLAVVLSALGHRDLAAREFEEALRINPGQVEAIEGLRALGR